MLAILLSPVSVSATAQTNAAEGITSGISGLGSTVPNLVEPILIAVFFFAVVGLIALAFKAPLRIVHRT